jgi:hypothetical protein
MTEQAQASHLARLQHELQAFEKEVHAARSENERRASLDRVNALKADIERTKSGRWVGPNT